MNRILYQKRETMQPKVGHSSSLGTGGFREQGRRETAHYRAKVTWGVCSLLSSSCPLPIVCDMESPGTRTYLRPWRGSADRRGMGTPSVTPGTP